MVEAIGWFLFIASLAQEVAMVVFEGAPAIERVPFLLCAIIGLLMVAVNSLERIIKQQKKEVL